MEIINPNVEIIDEYVNSNEKIRVKCKVCDNVWYASPSKLLVGRSCPVCGRRKVGEAKRNSIDKVLRRLNKVNPDIKLLGEYVSADKPILCKCLKCGFEWKPTMSNLYSGKGCPKCSGTYHRTHEEFVEELKSINPNIEVLGDLLIHPRKIKCIVPSLRIQMGDDSQQFIRWHRLSKLRHEQDF